MYNFNECKKGSNPTKDKLREILMADIKEFLIEKYGADNVTQVDGNMYAVCAGTRTLADGTDGEVCGTIEIVAKDFDVRVVESSGKVFQPYERLVEGDWWRSIVEERKAKEEENARKKAEREEKARKAREEKAKKKVQEMQEILGNET